MQKRVQKWVFELNKLRSHKRYRVSQPKATIVYEHELFTMKVFPSACGKSERCGCKMEINLIRNNNIE